MGTKQTGQNQITEGVIWKQILLFFFPIMLGTLFQQLYNTADAIVVGRFVGKEALACVGGSSGQLINLVVGFFVGLSSGATVIIARYYGARNKKDLNATLHTAAALSIVGSIIITVLGLILTPFMLRLMHTPENVMAHLFRRHRLCIYLQCGVCDPESSGGFQTSPVLSDRVLLYQYISGYPAGSGIGSGG